MLDLRDSEIGEAGKPAAKKHTRRAKGIGSSTCLPRNGADCARVISDTTLGRPDHRVLQKPSRPHFWRRPFVIRELLTSPTTIGKRNACIR